MFRGLNDESMITSQGGSYSVNVSSDLLSLYLKRPGCKIVYKRYFLSEIDLFMGTHRKHIFN